MMYQCFIQSIIWLLTWEGFFVYYWGNSDEFELFYVKLNFRYGGG